MIKEIMYASVKTIGIILTLPELFIGAILEQAMEGIDKR